MNVNWSFSVKNDLNTTYNVNTNPFSYVGNAQFMQLLLAQLRYQNPLDPMQNEEMIMQLTQINSLQELQSISDALTGLSRWSQMASASNLLGKRVQVMYNDGSIGEGVVTGISIVGNEVMLWVDDELIPFSSVVSVLDSTQGGA